MILRLQEVGEFLSPLGEPGGSGPDSSRRLPEPFDRRPARLPPELPEGFPPHTRSSRRDHPSRADRSIPPCSSSPAPVRFRSGGDCAFSVVDSSIDVLGFSPPARPSVGADELLMDLSDSSPKPASTVLSSNSSPSLDGLVVAPSSSSSPSASDSAPTISLTLRQRQSPLYRSPRPA